MRIGVVLLLALFVLPLWNITLEAPQYPTPIGMDIYINKFKGANDVHDIKNINLMNHYIGMKDIPETIPEMTIFPITIITMVVLGLLVAQFGKSKHYLIWLIIFSLLGIAGMYDFYLWEYDYGHNLNPHAIMSFTNDDGSPMGFSPPLFGSKTILNFVAHSYPRSGAYFMFLGMILVFIAYLKGRKQNL